MSIRVTCEKCHTRFNVSEKFAGQTGPCPKCKASIKIPAKSEEVVIKTPTGSGPTDTKGRKIIDPIKRKETSISPVQLTIIGVGIVGFLAVAFLLSTAFEKKSDFPMWLLGVSALLLAIPLAYVAYSFLRDQDLEPYIGKQLWGRVGICSVIYALTWLALPISAYAFGDSYEIGSYVIAGIALFGIGGVAAMFCFELDYFTGSVHYGLYLGVALLGRWLAGIGVLPENLPKENLPGGRGGATTISELLNGQIFESLMSMLMGIV
jgi:hypothetical protein